VAVEPERFAAEFWGRRPLLSRAAELPPEPATGFADLFGLDAVDELVSRRGLRTPFLRLAKDGTVVDPGRFTGPGGVGAEIADQVADDRVLELFLDGSTLVLQGLHRTWPALIGFAQQLGTDLGHPVQVNAYVTPRQNQGFSAHYDVHDVFVLQVAGEKRWLVHEPVLPDPLRHQPWAGRARAVADAARGTPALDAVLAPGDALYLPRGWLHAAQALGDVSAHVTVGVHPVTRYALVEALAALAADEPALRRSLPLGIDVADPAQLAPQLAETVAALGRWLEHADPAAVTERVRGRVWPQSRPEPIAPLAQAAAVAGLDQATRVRLRAHLRHTLGTGERAEGDQVVLQLPDRRLTLPAATEPALKALLTGEPTAVGELPGLDPEDRIVLVRRLLREAILVPEQP
jgi:hypothetical protein